MYRSVIADTEWKIQTLRPRWLEHIRPAYVHRNVNRRHTQISSDQQQLLRVGEIRLRHQPHHVLLTNFTVVLHPSPSRS